MVAQNVNTQVSYIVETVEGTTPTDPAFTNVRATGESFAVERGLSFSSELDGLRGQRSSALSSESGTGGFDFEFSDGSFEDFLEGLLRGTWADDVLTDASDLKSFSIETRFEDGAKDVIKRLVGAQVNTFALNLSAGEPITGSFGFLSRKATFENADLSNAVYNAANSEAVESGSTVDNLTIGGLSLDCAPSLSLNVNNNMRAENVLGTTEPCSIVPGQLEITGQASVFLSAAEYALLQNFQNGDNIALSFDVGKTADKILQFSLPNIVLESVNAVTGNAEGSVVAELNYRALQAASLSGSVIKITRNAE